MEIKQIILIGLLLNSCAPPTSEGPVPILELELDQRSLPQRCEQYVREYSDDEWDPLTETYPTNVAWEHCMGVAPVGTRAEH